jgi:hypothetical protein
VTAPAILKSEGPVEGFGDAACCAHAGQPRKRTITAADDIRRMEDSFPTRFQWVRV